MELLVRYGSYAGSWKTSTVMTVMTWTIQRTVLRGRLTLPLRTCLVVVVPLMEGPRWVSAGVAMEVTAVVVAVVMEVVGGWA